MRDVIAIVRSASGHPTPPARAAFLAKTEQEGGALSRKQFSELVLTYAPGLAQQQLKKLFGIVNTSASGSVTFAEFARFFELDVASEQVHDPLGGALDLHRASDQGRGRRDSRRDSQRALPDERGTSQGLSACRPHPTLPPKGAAHGAAARPALGELVARVFGFVPPLDFLRSVVPTERRWSLSWYAAELRAVFVPDDQPSITAGVNACTGSGGGGGLVLVRPGVYPEAVRLVRSCTVFGLGPQQSVVIEAPGWESPLVFVQGQRVCVTNVTVRCRIQAARGKCVYIPAGQPTLLRCRIEGGVHACGGGTSPLLRGCGVCRSPGHGLHFSDGSGGRVLDCVVEGNKVHGVLADRGASPEIHGNRIINNGGAGIRLLLGSRDSKAVSCEAPSSIGGNELTGNKQEDISLGPGFADGDDQDGAGDEEDGPLPFDIFGSE